MFVQAEMSSEKLVSVCFIRKRKVVRSSLWPVLLRGSFSPGPTWEALATHLGEPSLAGDGCSPGGPAGLFHAAISPLVSPASHDKEESICTWQQVAGEKSATVWVEKPLAAGSLRVTRPAEHCPALPSGSASLTGKGWPVREGCSQKLQRFETLCRNLWSEMLKPHSCSNQITMGRNSRCGENDPVPGPYV